MENKLSYREYQSSDAPYLADIIRKTWEYDRFCPPDTAKRMAHLYLTNCLCGQSYTQVALKDNLPVGIIMARAKKQKPAGNYKLSRIRAELSMLCHKEDRAVLKIFGGINSVDKELLKSRNIDYDGEIVFFALNENCRGTGIGKTLFTKAVGYLKEVQAKNFYLYTDSSCNYGFYEHQGMKRCGEKTCHVPVGIDNTMYFYLYEYQIA